MESHLASHQAEVATASEGGNAAEQSMRAWKSIITPSTRSDSARSTHHNQVSNHGAVILGVAFVAANSEIRV